MDLDRRTFLALSGGGILAAAYASEQDKPAKPNACPPCDDGNCPVDCVPQLPNVNSLPRGSHSGVVLDLPPELRTVNWGGGSCVHASNVNLLKHQGMPEFAEWWRNTYSGGENDSRLIARLEAAGLRYAWGRDEAFCEWCCRTRRGAGIFYKPNHSINLVGLDAQNAYLLDNNAVNYPERNGHYETVARSEFFPRWRGYGAFAWTLCYDPPPCTPTV